MPVRRWLAHLASYVRKGGNLEGERVEQKGLDRMNQIVKAVRTHWDQYGLPPTVRWLMEKVGVSSTSVMAYYLDKLVEEGRLPVGRTPSGRRKILRPEDERVSLQEEVCSAGADGQEVVDHPL